MARRREGSAGLERVDPLVDLIQSKGKLPKGLGGHMRSLGILETGLAPEHS